MQQPDCRVCCNAVYSRQKKCPFYCCRFVDRKISYDLPVCPFIAKVYLFPFQVVFKSQTG